MTLHEASDLLDQLMPTSVIEIRDRTNCILIHPPAPNGGNYMGGILGLKLERQEVDYLKSWQALRGITLRRLLSVAEAFAATEPEFAMSMMAHAAELEAKEIA